MDEQDKPTSKRRYVPLVSGTGRLIPAQITRKKSRYVPIRNVGKGKLVPAKITGKGKLVPAGTNQRRAAQPTRESKLTDAERTRLKGVLREALANVQFANVAGEGAGAQTSRLAVLLVGASEEEFAGETFALANEVLEEDANTFHTFYKRLLNRTQHAVSLAKANGVMIEKPIFGHTAHPHWYFGFWDDTDVTVQVESSANHGNLNVHLGTATVHFGEAGSNRPTLTWDLWSGNNGNNVKTISERVGLSEIVPPLLYSITRIIGYGHGDENVEEALLTVYNVFQWRDHWVSYFLIDRDGKEQHVRFVNPDLFDRIVITVNASEELTVQTIKIKFNNQVIYDDASGRLIKGGSRYRFDLESPVLAYRRRQLTYQGTTAFSSRQYDGAAISANRFLRIAVHELGKAWCRKYGSPWRIDESGEWKYGPDYWCGSSALWVMHEEGSLVHITNDPLPPPDKWGGAKWFFLNHRLYHPFNTSWSNLGQKIKPGDYVNMYGHAGFFQYWLALPYRPPNGHPKYNDLADEDVNAELHKFGTIFSRGTPALEYPDISLAPPGDFNIDSDINWFRFIAANTSERFNFGIGAVINLHQWRLDEVIKPLDNSDMMPKFVPWCHDHADETHGNDFNGSDSPAGFGRTDGLVVNEDFTPPWEE